MSDEERDELVVVRMSRAREALREAEVLMQQQLWRGSTNRLYYAMFYAAQALLATKNDYPKTHKGVRQKLSLHFVLPGGLSKPLADAYSELFQLRHSNDYDDYVSIDPETVTRLHASTIGMLNEAERILNR